MLKYLLPCLLLLMLSACQSRDEHYYRANPGELQAAIQQCPQNQKAKGLSCKELVLIANDVNGLILELQQDAKKFGSTILGQQYKLAKLQAELKTGGPKDKVGLEREIQHIKSDLEMRLAIVKWLLSPQAHG